MSLGWGPDKERSKADDNQVMSVMELKKKKKIGKIRSINDPMVNFSTRSSPFWWFLC